MSDAGAIRGLKIVLGLFVSGVTTLAIGAVILAIYVGFEFEKTGPKAEAIEFNIPRGAGISSVARDLEQQGIITNPLIFKIAGRITGDASKIKAGEYEIAANAPLKDILQQFVDGKTIARRFTIREGLTSFETVRLINGVEDLSGKITQTPAEGTLLPNTYDYQRGEDRSKIITRLQNIMLSALKSACNIQDETNINAIMSAPCKTAPTPLKTVGDILTLASIVEKETAQADERQTVAGVFLNRLNKGMPLQTDPTVIYAITKGKHKDGGKGPLGRRLLRKDLKIDDPYNTYKYPGLPPGPIANPGKASIEAVINPEENDYIFFVADGTGGHAFARTLKEHNANVAKWRKIRSKK
jgi:UPF0755 protein